MECDIVDYDKKTNTKIVGLETIIIHINSTILTKVAKYVAIVDIGMFYKNSRLESLEFTKCTSVYFHKNHW